MRASMGWVAVLAVAFAALAPACSGDGDASGEADSQGQAPDDDGIGSSGDSASTTTGVEPTTSTGPTVAPADVVTGIGADDRVIKVGYNADLSGAFSALVAPIIQATEVYWVWVNENGGVAERTIEPIVFDNGYDVPKHLENYEILAGDGPESVVMIGQSTGSPHTAATAERLVEDDLAAIPLSFYSGWADPEIGQNVFEVQTNYCLESMNGLTYLSEEYGPDVAIISFAGEYGQDGATGAKLAAEALDLNVVYDGEGAVAIGTDQTPIINEIVGADPDFVWASIDPGTLADIMGGAVTAGFTGQWAGNSPTFNFQLLGTDLAPALDRSYTHFAYHALWNTNDTPGMAEVVTQMREKRPDAAISDQYLIGWTNAMIVHQVLERAAATGDLTRAGVLATAREIIVDLKGLAPNQTWRGDPNDYIVRESYIYDVDVELFTPDLTVSHADAGTGFDLIEGPYLSPLARDFLFEGACYEAE